MALKQCALAGMGITLQGRWLIGKELRDGTLVDLFPEYETTAALSAAPAAWLLYPSRDYVPQKGARFRGFFEDEIQKRCAVGCMKKPVRLIKKNGRFDEFVSIKSTNRD